MPPLTIRHFPSSVPVGSPTVMIYADRPLRRAVQIGGDLLTLAWITCGIWAATTMYQALTALAHPGALLHDAGNGLTSHMETAADAAQGVPFVGEDLAAPFTKLGAAGENLSAAGTELQQAVAEFALLVALTVAVLATAVAVGVWLPVRLRWIRQATRARELSRLSDGAGASLLALRALTAAPVSALRRVHHNPVAAWHSGEKHAVAELAALELRRLGLHPPTSRRQPG